MADRQAAWEAWVRQANATKRRPGAILNPRDAFYAGFDAGGDEAVALLRRARLYAQVHDHTETGKCLPCAIDAHLEGRLDG